VATRSATRPTVDRLVDLSAPAASGAATPGEVQATISVGGDLNGQVAIGANIIQIRIDTLHGDLVTAAPATSAPAVRRRPVPLRLLPRRPATFLDREAETERLVGSLLAADAVDVVGPEGSGRSTLLRHVVHDPRLEALPAGVAHLSCAGDGPDDAARSLFDTFYETSAPYRPSRGELRQRLDAIDAALLLDDVHLTSDETARLLDLVPRAGVVLATDRSVTAASVRLGPLPGVDAIELVRTSAEVDPTVAARIGATGISPQAVLRAGAAAAGTPLSEDGRRALRLLASVPGLRLDTGQLLDLGVGDGSPEGVGATVDDLVASGLLLRHAGHGGDPERFGTVSDEASSTLRPEELEEGHRAVAARFRAWAREHRHTVRCATNEATAARVVLDEALRREDAETAVALGLAIESTFAVTGRWEAWRGTLAALELAASWTGAEDVRAFVRHQQGVLEICEGRPAIGAALLEEALRLRDRLGDDAGAEVTRANLRIFRPPPPPSPPTAPSPWLPLMIVAAVAVGGALAWFTFGGWPLDPETLTETGGESGEDEAALVVVPHVIARPLDEGLRLLEEVGLAAEVSEEGRADVAPGLVLDQDPEPGTEVSPGSSVRLVVATRPPADADPDQGADPDPGGEPERAPGTEQEGDGPGVVQVPVPGVVGQDVGDASARIRAAGLAPVRVDADEVEPPAERIPEGRVTAGTVIRQSPAAGVPVRQGTVVELVVLSEDAVVVPDVLGRHVPAATERLEELEFVVEDDVLQDHPEPDRACEVVAQDPAPGSIVPSGWTVELRYVDDGAGGCRGSPPGGGGGTSDVPPPEGPVIN
jgi:beta-lactam-binding protein with PASTA domain